MFKALLFDLNGVLLYNTHEGSAFIKENTSLLPKLASRYKLAVISNAPSRYREELKKEGILEYFSTITLSEEIGFNKPDAELFEITLSNLGVRADEVIFIDDSYDNIVAAEKLGITTVYYDGSEQLQEQLTKKGIVV